MNSVAWLPIAPPSFKTWCSMMNLQTDSSCSRSSSSSLDAMLVDDISRQANKLPSFVNNIYDARSTISSSGQFAEKEDVEFCTLSDERSSEQLEPPELAKSGVFNKNSTNVLAQPKVFQPIVMLTQPDDCSNNHSQTQPIDAVMHLLHQKESQLTALQNTMEQNEEAMTHVFEEWQQELEQQLVAEGVKIAQCEATLKRWSHRAQQAEMELHETHNILMKRSHELAQLSTDLQKEKKTSNHYDNRCFHLQNALRETCTALDVATGKLKSLTCHNEKLNKHIDVQTQTDYAPWSNDSADVMIVQLQQLLISKEAQFDKIRAKWIDEKTKVTAYQRRIEHDYLQLYQKSHQLELKVEQLTLDLQRKSKTLVIPAVT